MVLVKTEFVCPKNKQIVHRLALPWSMAAPGAARAAAWAAAWADMSGMSSMRRHRLHGQHWRRGPEKK